MIEFTPSCSKPLLVRLPVRVKSVFKAPVPLYAREIASAWSAHTVVQVKSAIMIVNEKHTVAEPIHKCLKGLYILGFTKHTDGSQLLRQGPFGQSRLYNVGSV